MNGRNILSSKKYQVKNDFGRSLKTIFLYSIFACLDSLHKNIPNKKAPLAESFFIFSSKILESSIEINR
jgi:hypothetical protein